MKCIENKIFYHIQRNVKWEVGQTHFIGRAKNNFCEKFDKNGALYKHPNEEKFYDVNKIADAMINFIDNNRKDPILEPFYHFNANETIKLVSDSLKHYLQATRELIFEEIRKDFFPHLPSRQRGLWIIPENNQAVAYWWKTLGEKGTIFQVEVTGKIHQANQQYLTLSTNSFDWIREQAFKYWAAATGKDSIENECLFEGFVNIIAKKTIEDFV